MTMALFRPSRALCVRAMSRWQDETRRQAFVSAPTDRPTPRDGLMASVSTGRAGSRNEIEASVAAASAALLTCWRSILGQFSRLQGAGRQTNRAVDILRRRRYLRTSVGVCLWRNRRHHCLLVLCPPPSRAARCCLPSHSMRTIDVHPTRAYFTSPSPSLK